MVETNIILGLIRHNKDFRKGFMQKARDIYADIISFIANPNCTCRKRIVKYVEENKENVNEYYEEFKQTVKGEDFEKLIELIKQSEKKNTKEVVIEKKDLPDNLKKSLTEPVNRTRRTDVRGEVVEISLNPFDYKDVIETGKKENWYYRGLTVVETIRVENEIEKPVWLIFFY
jgi:hypothetical protein